MGSGLRAVRYEQDLGREGLVSRGDDCGSDQAQHDSSGAVSGHALRGPAARGRRGDDHARARDRDRVDPRPRACDLPHGRSARGASSRTTDGPVRPHTGHLRGFRHRLQRLRSDGPRVRLRLCAARDSRVPRHRRDERNRAALEDGRRRHVSGIAQGARDLVRPLRFALRCCHGAADLPSALRREGLRAGHTRRPVVRRGRDVRSSG